MPPIVPQAADYCLGDSHTISEFCLGAGSAWTETSPMPTNGFTLAARDGDKESIAKRDDVGGRLDPQSLSAANLAAQAWTPRSPNRHAGGYPGRRPWTFFAAPQPGNRSRRNPRLQVAPFLIPLTVH